MADNANDVKEPVNQDTVEAPSTEENKPDVAEDKVEDKVTEILKSDDDKPSENKPEDKPKSPEPETDKPKDEEKKAEKPEEKPEEPAEEETKGEDKPTKADERKQKLNTEIRDLVSKRNALKEEVEKKNSEVYQPATEDELTDQVNPETGENYTKLEAKIEEMRQSQELEKFNSQVAEAQLTIGSESERVLNDFPIFNPDSDQFDKELAEEAAGLLEANLILDPNSNQVIGSNVSPYQLYKTLARASGISTAKGQMEGQKATEKMLANADTVGSTSPPKKAKDPVLEILSSDDY
jgi:hypothetical protein